MKKVDDLTKQKIELYIDDGVIEELEDKITRNFGVLGSEQSERAGQMFHQINIALYNIANGINVDISNHISANHFFYDVCPHNDVICSVLFDAYAINKHTPAFIVNRIVWKYHNLDWWKIVENKYINTKHNMKSLQQYISEQMVCELSSELLGRAEAKAKGKRKQNFGWAKEKAYMKERLPILLKLEKNGFILDNLESYEEDDYYVAYVYKKLSNTNITYVITKDEDKVSYEAYVDGKSVEENRIVTFENGEIEYSGYKLEDRKAIKEVVDFGKICGFNVDKNEIMA